MAEALVSQILKQLATLLGQEFKLVTGVEEDISRLQSNLISIHTLLQDAEEKQRKDPNIKLWLDKLKAASYDMEDALDQWNTELFKLKIRFPKYVPLLKRKVCDFYLSCLPFGRQVCINHEIGAKIQKINKDLDEIHKEKDRYQLMRREIKQPRRPETTSFASDLFGRDLVKTEIISKLLAGEGDSTEGVGEIQTISIVGMGGIGKTSLAQMIFNHVDVRAHFDERIWVCVSDFFDQTKIGRAILEALGDLEYLKLPQVSLETILSRICEMIKEKKIFLVLDDVWTDHDEDWAAFKATLKSSKPESRILVTTRKDSVVRVMGSSHTFRLEELSDEVCWLILRQAAFTGRVVNSECEKFEDIGRKIANKCKGLPLAAKTLGSLLREKTSRNEWQNVLDSDLWTLKIAEEFIFTPLLLSYYDLPSTIRQCLLYCAIFPKDYKIYRYNLILHWMAHGYLNCDDESLEVELKGEEYFNYLVARSFFQDFERNSNGTIYGCKMHDLVHDFVQFLIEDGIVAMEANSSKRSRFDGVSKKARHLRVTTVDVNLSVNELRSLVIVCGISSEDLQRILNRAKSLRLLDFGLDVFAINSGFEKFPKNIRHLIHLRYLDLSWNISLLSLPEAVCELYNLQVLNLFYCCNLKRLPDGIWKLINLRYLYTERCSLVYYPKGIGSLTSLRRLDTIRARVDGSGGAKEFGIGDMENLDFLCKDIWLELVGNEIDKEEAKRAKLHNKRLLKGMYICLKGNMKKYEVIRALHPPPNLRMEFIGDIFEDENSDGYLVERNRGIERMEFRCVADRLPD